MASEFTALWMRIFFTLLAISWLAYYIIKNLTPQKKQKIAATKKTVEFTLKQLKEIK